MFILFHYLNAIFGHEPFLFFVTILSLSLKTFILVHLILHSKKTVISNKRSWTLTTLVLISAMIIDLAWVMVLIKTRWFPNMPSLLLSVPLRLSWSFFAIQYQALMLFIESLINPTRLKLRHILSICISATFFCFGIGIAIWDITRQETSQRPPIEFLMRTIENIYILAILVPLTLLIVFFKMRSTPNVPIIVRQQLKIFIPTIVIPLWFFDMLQMFPLSISPTWITNSYAAATLTTILLTCALLYCARRVIELRFLNFHEQVQSKNVRYNFIDGFKDVLEQLSHATGIAELRHITQTLFKDAFEIPITKTHLYIRKIKEKNNAEANKKNDQTQPQADDLYDINSDTKLVPLIENFLNSQPEEILKYIADSKILIYDEIAFTNFYEKNNQNQAIMQFLDMIDADIFLPIYEKQTMIAYIIVERYARPDQLYGHVEHDEMLVFSSYLANIINLLQTRNLKMLIQQEKKLKEELYLKHQEINQYKESIRSFLHANEQREIGILFYKNRTFMFGNKAAKDLVTINPNTQEGHPITRSLKKVARHVEEYKTAHTVFTQDKNGNRLVLAGVPHLENNTVIITIYHPEISDIVKHHLELLRNPSKWDYLLYLETTTSGKLINQIIPGTGPILLNFKIDLLEMALSKKALLLEMSEEDLRPMVDIIHHISLKETLHVIKLNTPARNHDIAIKLFGINNLFGMQTQAGKPLLEQLNNSGTLFIQNINFLDLETQEYLAEFLTYGLYRTFKSDQKVASNVRIICSTNQHLPTLVQEGTFSKALFNELKATALTLPSLLTLPEEELNTLADGFIEQLLKTEDLKNLLDLTDKEKLKFAYKRPVSLHELRERIQQTMLIKSKKHNLTHDAFINSTYQISDPQLMEAARLGKHALRDQKTMTLLWDKFKNQAKIATFLGVNRSSVNRRCKEFNLE